MIIKRIWKERAETGDEWTIEGWYLFGFVPLYIRDLESRGTWAA